MQKILITSGIFPPEIGGPASYAVALGRYLAEKGFGATVISYSLVKKDPSDASFPFRVIRIWKKWPKSLRHIIYFFTVLIQSKGHDVIFSLNAVSAGLPALISSRIRGKKFFVKIVGDYSWEMAVYKGRSSFLIGDFQKATKRGWIKILANVQYWVCEKANGVIVPSRYLADLVKDWGVNSLKIHVIYNGVDFQPSDLSREEARKKIGIPGNIILSSGRLMPWKGFRMLIKIMPRLLEVNQFFRLVIIGDGPEKKNLELMIKNMNLDRKVFLVGRKSKEEMAVYMAASEIFVLNSGYEGFSHQILEAMTAGVPVIVSAIGGNKEVVEQGKNGFLVKYNDEFNLIEAIKGLWESPELREEFIKNGKETVKKFSAERMIKETIEVLSL